MIVWLASYPRSGNTFFRILLHSLYGLKTYTIYDAPVFEQLGAADTIGEEPLPGTIEELHADTRIFFIKTHQLPRGDSPAIYLVRDGRDAVVSYAHYLKTFWPPKGKKAQLQSLFQNTFLKNLTLLVQGNEHYGGWSNNVLAWTRERKQGQTILLKYEDLILDPNACVQGALEDLGLEPEPVDGTELLTFTELHSRWPGFFRKGQVGSWKSEMPQGLQELFWKNHGHAMDLFHYPRGDSVSTAMQ